MPIKSVNQLRARFDAGSAPTQQDYLDLLDTIAGLANRIDEVLILLQSVVLVADADERLSTGPTLNLYRKVKQADNGRTYVLQTGDGSRLEDWEVLGDSQLSLGDVEDLESELARRLIRSADTSTSGDLGLLQIYQSAPAVDSSVESDTLDIQFARSRIVVAYRGVDFTIHPVIVDPETINAQTTVLVKNIGVSPIQIHTARPVGIDFAFVLDQSGSMADSRLLMPDLVRGLEDQLNAIGVGVDPSAPNRYAMVEFGAGRPAWPEIPFTDYATFLAATQTFDFPTFGWAEDSGARTASQTGTQVTLSGGGTFVFTDTLTDAGRQIHWDSLQTAIIVSVEDSMHATVDVSQEVPAGEFTALIPNPQFWQEDGYEGLDRAMDMLAWRDTPSVTKLLFLMTDEDRNSARSSSGALPVPPVRIFSKGGPTWQEQRAFIKQRILDGGFVLAGLFGQKTPMLQDEIGNIMLGMDYTGRCYAADGDGGYTDHTGGHSWPSPDLFSKYDTSDFSTGPTNTTPGQYEDYFELMMDAEVKGYALDIWEYRDQQEPAEYVTGSNTASQAGNIVTLTVGETGGYLFTSTAVDGGRKITISGAASPSMILQVNSATEAVVHNTQDVSAAAFSVARRQWQGYIKNAQQEGTTVTLSSDSILDGWLFGSTATDAGAVIRFATGDFATIVSVIDSTHAEVDVSQSVPMSAFLVWPNAAAAKTSRSVLAAVVPMLTERIRQELTLFIVARQGLTFPMELAAGGWAKLQVTGATVPVAGTIPGRKLLLS